ncbi:UDP-N-acetylmuramoyl-L-alanyl-D-glutamate--2,6-diaminopimelate ligase [Thiorhodospira sibirica]|uniref:UDP-N-acetylmuramoyl-L-alanyl-D-glutamate--2, 6-diaminopimelate ligase n=1 Tax=Thiorhodospira sibirica TaxID=154347 RepID=UPI00022C4010|nr:UDP-N-acetylmuramoyl-L-alanyl-D-glutamate--2,6-diaminopimelate ligase [Thiorhodospira sibirica]
MIPYTSTACVPNALLPQQSLSQLCQLLELPPPLQEVMLSGLCLDSRKIVAGEVFLALAGSQQHGLQYAAQAQALGASVILWEPAEGVSAEAAQALGIPCMAVPELSRRLALLAHRFYGEPSQALKLIGVTGTNGKTSVTQFLAQILDGEHIRCGVIGTLGAGVPGELQDTGHTTPDSLSLHKTLALLRAQDVRYATIEVSSHALDQGRVEGVAFDLAVLTQLGRDHLDYHLTLEQYAQAKARLFHWPGLEAAVLNLDDPFGQRLAQAVCHKIPVIGYGLQANTQGHEQILAQQIRYLPQGIACEISSPWGSGVLETPLLGRFNLYNSLAVLAVALQLGMRFSDVMERLHHLHPLPGRMEVFHQPGRPTLMVDYAHTPDALIQVLQALRDHQRGRIWCVFGCGGGRDRGKRPLMAQAAQAYADAIVLTNDNPRHEDPQQIAQEILQSFNGQVPVLCELNRARAIALAFSQAEPSDTVLIAGKGHESSQFIGDQVFAFSDRAIAAQLLS